MTSRGYRTIGPMAAICVALVAGSARAEPVPGRLALVFGQSAYTNMPPVPGCAASAQAVANRLQQLGFDVISQIDASNGAMSAALSDFAHRKTLATDPRVVVYVCARAIGFENRVFLLPVTASVTRPSDVLTEGIPAQSIIDLAGQNTAVSLTVLDTFGAEDPDAFAKRQHLAPGHFLVVAVEPTIGTTATPLSQALSTGLATPPADVGAILGGLQQSSRSVGITFAATGDSGSQAALLAPPIAPPVAPSGGHPTAQPGTATGGNHRRGASPVPSAAGSSRRSRNPGTAGDRHAGRGSIRCNGSAPRAGRAAAARLLRRGGGRAVRARDAGRHPALSARAPCRHDGSALAGAGDQACGGSRPRWKLTMVKANGPQGLAGAC